MSDGVTINLHYSRAGRPVSPRKTRVFVSPAGIQAALAAAVLLAPLAVWAQYPGQITKKTTEVPALRAVAVLEWTGEAGKPKACRIVPITVFDGEKLQDGGVYLARPQPLALTSDVEYELKKNGKTIGLFDVKTAGQEQGSWIGHGDWRQLPKPRASVANDAMLAKIDDDYSDKPVLHRKHTADDKGAGSGNGSGASSGTAAPGDPDRPTLHKHDSGQSTASAEPAPDPDRPTLHKPTSNDSSDGPASDSGKKSGSDSGSSNAKDDPDRPTLKKGKQRPPEDIGHVESVPDATDPDRPKLKRGKSSGNGAEIAPTLMGLPPDMQQAVAVSDPRNRPDHIFSYRWANPDDEQKMKSAMEDIARQAMAGPAPVAAPKPATKRTPAGTAARKSAKPAPPPPPSAPLEDEQFRVFELAYGSGATMVLTAHSAGPLNEEKFVTLVAQPDLYGNVLVLLKYVADGAHLDFTPRMHLIDAVDAEADNRGELLFELRGRTQRQFALYRVLRGQAQKLFVSGGGEFGTEASD